MSEIKLTTKTLALMVIGTIIIGGASGFLFSGLRNRNQQDENTFTLVAYLSGYVGEGGDIDGQTNPTLQVTPGSSVTIILKAGENTAHDFTIDELGIQTDLVSTIEAYDDEITITFVAPAGQYTYYCSISGHFSTMNGQIAAGEPDTPDPARDVDVDDIRKDPFEAGTPIGSRTTPTTLNYTIEAHEVVAEIEPGTTFTYWTYNQTVPGPIVRGMVGDTINITLYNDASSTQNHSIDLHAVTGTGGGAAVLQAAPGEYSETLSFEARHEGTFIYHCASPHIPTHISKGMYGAVVIEPVGGLPDVDVELFIGQNEVYTQYPMGTPGHNEFDDQAQVDEEPNYVNFNGMAFGYFGNNNISITQNSTVRIFFAVGGPNLISSFHMIGEIWDRVWYETNFESGTPMLDAETVLVAPGSVLMVELEMEEIGAYIIVDHALSRVFDKGAGFTIEVTG